MGVSNSKVDSEGQIVDPPPVYYSRSLEVLDGLQNVRVQQQMPRDLKECCHGNSYKVFDENGNTILRILEKPDCNNCCSRWWCGPARGFRMVAYDNNRRPIMYMRRHPCRCDAWCCLDCVFCSHRITISDGDKNYLGFGKQKCSCCAPNISIVDSTDEPVGTIRGPCCPCRCLCDLTFNVFTPDGKGPSVVKDFAITDQPGSMTSLKSAESYVENFYYSGKIEKRWTKSTYPRINMDHENIMMRIPDDMDTVERALLLGSMFLVDFMYFEVS